MPNRKIIVYIATSADGFIARKDGAVDWLERPRPKGNYGMGEFYNSIDTVVFGRKTYDMTVKFLEEGVHVDYRDDGGCSALHRAVEANKIEVVRLLLAAGASTTELARAGDTPLHIAAREGSLDVLRAMLEAKAKPDAWNAVRLAAPLSL